MTTVLVIEDDPIILDNILEILDLEGFDVLGAEDGVAGLEQAQKHLPDLIICDILMPKLDGYGVLSQLRAEPNTSAIPLIFVSATPREEIVAASVRLGASDYLLKPFRTNDLLRIVRNTLNGQKT